MSRKPEQRSLDEVRELLRSLEDSSADDGLAGPQPRSTGETGASASEPVPAREAKVRPSAPEPVRPVASAEVMERPSPPVPAVVPLARAAMPATVPSILRATPLGRQSQPHADPATDPAPERRGAKASIAAGVAVCALAAAAWYVLVGSGDPKYLQKIYAIVGTSAGSEKSPDSDKAGAGSAPPRSTGLEREAVRQGTGGAPLVADREPSERIARAPSGESEKSATPITGPGPTVAMPTAPMAEPSGSLRLPTALDIRAGVANPFPITIDPPGLRMASMVMITGLPGGAGLSHGRIVQDGVWSIPGSEAAGLQVLFAENAVGSHELTVELRSTTSALLAAASTSLRVSRQPAAPASAAAVADPVRLDEAETLRILADGKRQLAGGHVAPARLLFQRAADGGSGEAARMLGDTWDPAKLFMLGVRGTTGDVEKAIYWYERADELGDPQAKARLLALGR